MPRRSRSSTRTPATCWIGSSELSQTADRSARGENGGKDGDSFTKEKMPLPRVPTRFWRRDLASYPALAPRIAYLSLAVFATVILYYQLYVGSSVSTLILDRFDMTFTFYVVALAIGSLIGAFGSLLAGLTDRFGRANLVVCGLFLAGVLTAFAIPASPNKWVLTLLTFAVGAVAGFCLTATPALVRDFSPQVGRATAMGFWTAGPVLGSLLVSVIASHTIGANPSPDAWAHEFRIAGIIGLGAAMIALLWMRELRPGIRDQVMVDLSDQALIEVRAEQTRHGRSCPASVAPAPEG